MSSTAGIVIIGNEILSGLIQDQNSSFMAQELRVRGVDLRQITVIPDEQDEIARVVREFSVKYDYVFTSGGIGPTHDDVTIEGISEAFHTTPAVSPDLRQLLQERYGDRLTPEVQKMALIPEGAELIKDKVLKFPVIRYRNVFIYPGIPDYLKEKFVVTTALIKGRRFFTKKLYIRTHEAMIVTALNGVVKNYRDVKIGSYPLKNNIHPQVLITFESLAKDRLEMAFEELRHALPEGTPVSMGSTKDNEAR